MTPEDIAALPYRPCVGVMLVNKHGQAFVGQRIDNNQDAWQMPQGGVDKGEDPQDAAFRELCEETGVTRDKIDLIAQTNEWQTYDLPLDLVPKIWKGRYRGQKQLWYLFRFKGTDADISIETEIPEFSAWKWLDVSDLSSKIVPFKRQLYENVVAELTPHISWV